MIRGCSAFVGASFWPGQRLDDRRPPRRLADAALVFLPLPLKREQTPDPNAPFGSGVCSRVCKKGGFPYHPTGNFDLFQMSTVTQPQYNKRGQFFQEKMGTILSSKHVMNPLSYQRTS